MTEIRELFRRQSPQPIEDVIKVDVGDDDVVAAELEEYVVTDRIRSELEEVVREYVDCFDDRSDRTNVWISGFFGSGKSSFAKVLGYLLENRSVNGRPVSDRFFDRVDSVSLRASLSRALDPKNKGTAVTALLDLSSAHDVETEEHVVLPIYRAVLQRLGYAREPKLAALEFDLETPGGTISLDEFSAAFETIHARPWNLVRHTTLAPNMASRVLHELDSATFPSADSWSRSFEAPTVDANWFARRAVELVDRRGGGATRLVIIVDETGQYVSRSRTRMLALQGLAEAVQKQQGRLFLVTTSQERLEEVVDSLEGRGVELARVKDRFPIRVDLTASDIREVVAKRVLEKRSPFDKDLEVLVSSCKEQLSANLRLDSERRSNEFSIKDFVDLYPLLPYQVQLLIDAVTVRRSQLRAGAPLGGSNRTLISHAHKLLHDQRHGIGNQPVGALVTVDRSFDLLVEVIDSGLLHQVDQVGADFGTDSLEARIMKVVALVHDVRSLPLSPRNLAVLLHHAVDAESIQPAVEEAVAHLELAGWIREVDGGYQLQSAEQRQWDEKRQLDFRPGDEVRERRRILSEELGSRLTVSDGRAFKVGLVVDGEQVSDGEVVIEYAALTDADQPDDLLPSSRQDRASNRVLWWFRQDDDGWESLREVFRSRTMIDRHGGSSMTDAVRELVAEERGRQRKFESQFLERLRRDLDGGGLVFQGARSAPPTGTFVEAAQSAVRQRLSDVYPHLATFAARVDTKTALQVARSDNLAALPDSLGPSGVGLYRMTPAGAELDTDSGPIALMVAEVRRRADFGQEATGQYLERVFGSPPYGAAVEVVQTVVAAALRAGLVEISHQGSRIASVTDPRLDAVFRGVAPFRSTVIRPPVDTGPDLATRSRLAQRLTEYTGDHCPVATEELAARLRTAFDSDRQLVSQGVAFLTGSGLAVPSVVSAADGVMRSLPEADDGYVVSAFASSWDDLLAGLAMAVPINDLMLNDPTMLATARIAAALSDAAIPEEMRDERTELARLLASSDVVSHVAEVRALSERLSVAHHGRRAEVIEVMEESITSTRREVLEAFVDLDAETVAATIDARLADLAPDTEVSVEQLLIRRDRIDRAKRDAQADLDALRSNGKIERVDIVAMIGEVRDAPITTVAELDAVLDAVRARVLGLLDAGQEVRLT